MIILNKSYIHYNNKKTYTTLNFCKMQVNDIWLDSVLYTNDSNELFVREVSDFEKKFKEA